MAPLYPGVQFLGCRVRACVRTYVHTSVRTYVRTRTWTGVGGSLKRSGKASSEVENGVLDRVFAYGESIPQGLDV